MAAREAAVYTAKLAEQAHRYDDMAEAMKIVALMDVELTAEEGNLLFLAHENMITTRQASVTRLKSIDEDEDEDEVWRQRNAEYINKVEEEASRICDEFISILQDHVIPSCRTFVDRVYFFKMIGDDYAHRVGDDRIRAATESIYIYQLATMIAEIHLSGSDPIRLGLALNFAVMEYTMFDQQERAFKIVDEALQNVNDEEVHDSLEIINILVIHLTLWHIYMLEDSAEKAREELRSRFNIQI